MVPSFLPSVLPAVEVGWLLARPWWGRGLATEAGAAAIDWGFGGLGLDRLISIIYADNAPSLRVADKLGMTRWATEQHPRSGRELALYERRAVATPRLTLPRHPRDAPVPGTVPGSVPGVVPGSVPGTVPGPTAAATVSARGRDGSARGRARRVAGGAPRSLRVPVAVCPPASARAGQPPSAACRSSISATRLPSLSRKNASTSSVPPALCTTCGPLTNSTPRPASVACASSIPSTA